LASSEFLNSQNTGDTDADNWPEIVDGWGHPINFWRWPTRFIRSAQPSSVPVPKISVDPSNSEQVEQWSSRRAVIPALPPAAQLPTSGPPTQQQIDLSVDADDLQGLSQSCMSYYQANFHDVATMPMWLLCSSGEDDLPGIWYPGDTINGGYVGAPRVYQWEVAPFHYNYMRDNITNLNIKAGGK
jgi:hypothetical protein